MKKKTKKTKKEDNYQTGIILKINLKGVKTPMNRKVQDPRKGELNAPNCGLKVAKGTAVPNFSRQEEQMLSN